MQDFGDIPIYTAQRIPFDSHPPTPPVDNPTGVYRRSFVLPDAWTMRRMVLHVGAAISTLLVEVNGRPAGIGKDSRLASEVDITDLLLPGENELVLRVVRFSDATFVENQDSWWHGGITRSVYLYATENVHLGDVQTRSALDGDGARLSIRATVRSARGLLDSGWTVTAAIEGLESTVPVPVPRSAPSLGTGAGGTPDSAPASGAEIGDVDLFDLASRRAAGAQLDDSSQIALRVLATLFVPQQLGIADLEIALPGVRTWTAETPWLYTLDVVLRDPHGEAVETARYRIGFRDVVVVDGELLVNGQPILLQGVNRHDFDPYTGVTVTREQTAAQLRLLKRHGINAIRTAHYPNDPSFLELCDEYGFYVVDEANLETHNYSTTLCDDPRYLSAFVERAARMAVRDANHPSVIMWSLGNESSSGANHHAVAGWLRAFDTRPLHYEGAIVRDWHGGHTLTDIVAPMYPSVNALRAYAENPRSDRPLIMSEYSHSMGNSNGGLDEFWDLIETTRGLQGGFIWELTDHGLDPDRDGRYRYGGDFGDEPNDGNFCIDGLLFPDGTPHPAMEEARRLFTPIDISATGPGLLAGHVEVRNRQFFQSSEHYRVSARVDFVDGTGDAFELNLPIIGPRLSVVTPLPDEARQQLGSPGALGISFEVRLAREEPWADAATPLAVIQVCLLHEIAIPPIPSTVRGATASHLLTAEPTIALWRPPTDNDAAITHFGRFSRSGFADPRRTVIRNEDVGDAMVVHTMFEADGMIVEHERRSGHAEDGAFVVHERVVVPPEHAGLLRIGTVLSMPDGYTHARWWGRGPHESYPDRKRGARLGRWDALIDDLQAPYVKPQENGSHADTWMLQLGGANVPTIRVRLDRPCQVGVSRHTVAEIATSGHSWELPASTRAFVHLDVAHRGLGTTSVGPNVAERFRVGPGTYEWSWALDEVPASR